MNHPPSSLSNAFASFDFKDPILVVTVMKPAPTADEWEWTKRTMVLYYEAFDRIGGRRIALIFDIGRLSVTEPSIFQDWAALFIEYKEYTMRCIHRTCVITNNVVVQMGLNLFFSLYTTVRPMKFAANLDEAHKFVTEGL